MKGGSHGLLLRLLDSYFSVNIALKYLQDYHDNIGITYYLTRRLSAVPVRELIPVWNFICHLLLTRPSRSRALECFVIDTSQKSSHIALLTLWFMQAALQDGLSRGHTTQSFRVCQRILHRCHEIIFSDNPTPSSSPYTTVTRSLRSLLPRKKIRHHAEPVAVGLGMVLASIAQPHISHLIGEVSLEQSRAEEIDSAELRSIAHDDEDAPVTLSPQSSSSFVQDNDNEITGIQIATPERSLSLDQPSTVAASRTVPSLPLHLQGIRRSRASEDPLGQLDRELPSTSPHHSSPSLPLSSRQHFARPSPFNLGETLLQRYDSSSLTQLLRNHYCRSEVQFMLTLENISNRLLIVPRPARVSALRAELTSLNHKLPSEICMPLWCTSSSDIHAGSIMPEPHHRIVRIPPGESVVLNSAEKAPYLLYLEILVDDLDFHSEKRGNKDLLKKLVIRDAEKIGVSKDLSTSFTESARLPANEADRQDLDVGEVSPPSIPEIKLPEEKSRSTKGVISQDDEEVDLVEQIYGADTSLRSTAGDLSDTVVLQTRPKNKDLDQAAWSLPATPALEAQPTMFGPSSTSSSRNHSPHPPSRAAPKEHNISLQEYSDRMRTAAIMLSQLNANLAQNVTMSSMIPGLPNVPGLLPSVPDASSASAAINWASPLVAPLSPPGTATMESLGAQAGPVHPSLRASPSVGLSGDGPHANQPSKMRLSATDAAAIRDRIMQEMLALEEERMDRMREYRVSRGVMRVGDVKGSNTAEDENIIRKELDKADPSAAVFSESWSAKKSRIRNESPYGHLANWDCISVIVKTGGDLRQEQLAIQLIREFQHMDFQIVITGGTSGLMETITDAVSIHSIKKAEYARRLATGGLGHVSLLDHFKTTYGDPSSVKYSRAQKNFAKSLAGYSIACFLLQIKDRHNGNILVDRDGHLIHIDFGFILSNSPGNIGFEAAPFKLPSDYVDVLGGVDSPQFLEFRRLFHEGFKAARKHCDRIITLVELMQKDSTMPCFAAFGDQTANQLRERFQPSLTHMLIGDYIDKLIDSSLFSNWTRLYDSFQYYSQSIL
ncbi:kinase-like protein [Flagelloscypha sp. PMI_526]|nr:kinase-like protein [Flagelloscypha sp. PMI_526]